jgi:hypothetical protein
MKSKDLYRKVLRVCRNDAPKGQEQEYRFWLAYHAKNLMLLNRQVQNPEYWIEKGNKELESIRNVWKIVEKEGIVRRNPRYKFSESKGWLPGMATSAWIKSITK